EELLRLGIGSKLSWACQTRADTVDPEILDAMKAAGCRLIHFGVESANPDVLARTQKKITVDQIRAGVSLAKAKGIQTACFFRFGLPGETPELFQNTRDFARDLNPTYASFHFAVPFPGTPLYQEYLTRTGAPFGSWPRYYFEGWSPEKIRSYLARSMLGFYL